MAKKGLLATRLEKMQQPILLQPTKDSLEGEKDPVEQTPLPRAEEGFFESTRYVKKQMDDQQKLMFREILEEVENTTQRKEVPDKRWKLSTRILNIFLVVCCVYVLFLIYGVVMTDYQYNSDGKIEPQVLSVSELKKKDQYETIYYQYLHCRTLYEKVLLLDYRIGKGEEDPMTIAPEYESLLDEVTDLSIKTDALEVDTQYSQVKTLLLKWIKDDIAVYLQNMSAAISQNNTETANNALQDKDRVYSDFSIITQNMVAMGEQIQGIDLTELREWTPENYVKKKINGE